MSLYRVIIKSTLNYSRVILKGLSLLRITIKSIHYLVLFAVFNWICYAGNEIKELDGFLVTAYDDKFKIISPEKSKNTMEVTIENKTLVRLIGYLAALEGQSKLNISVPPGKFRKYTVKLKNKEKIIFLPLSPAFQEVELKVGQKTYEIPPQK